MLRSLRCAALLTLTLVLGMGIFWVGLADILNQYQPLATDALQFLRDLARAR